MTATTAQRIMVGNLPILGMNIAGMTNKSKGDYAYVLIDVDSPVTDEVIQKLENIEGVLKVRKVK